MSAFSFHVGGETIHPNQIETEEFLGQLLQELKVAVGRLSEAERNLLQRILSHSDKPLTVRAIFPEFQRGSQEHDLLRSLRGDNLVRPSAGEHWRIDKQINVAPTLRFFWGQIGLALLGLRDTVIYL